MNQTYEVKSGDTLYGISNQFGVSVTELANLNNVNANTLKVGQILKIPNSSGTNPNNMFMYTVQKGDSLWSIAKKYGTTVNAIKDLNYLKSNNLSIGQIIRIPEMYTPQEQMTMPNYKNYIVKKGDNLYSISKNNNISIDTIIKDNSLSNNVLTIGQVLKIRIPEGEITEILECFGPDYTPPETTQTITYTVQKGDNLYTIARKYNTTVSIISNFNNLKNNNLSIGQKLNIPVENSNPLNSYVVQKGDSLYTIAKKFNTTVDDIKRKNNLTSNLLSIGQKLKI